MLSRRHKNSDVSLSDVAMRRQTAARRIIRSFHGRWLLAAGIPERLPAVSRARVSTEQVPRKAPSAVDLEPGSRTGTVHVETPKGHASEIGVHASP